MHLQLTVSEDAMQTAIEALQAKGYRPRKTSEHQIKVGPWNFWPEKGTITRDGQRGRHSDIGLESFLQILARDLSQRRT